MDGPCADDASICLPESRSLSVKMVHCSRLVSHKVLRARVMKPVIRHVGDNHDGDWYEQSNPLTEALNSQMGPHRTNKVECETRVCPLFEPWVLGHKQRDDAKYFCNPQKADHVKREA